MKNLIKRTVSAKTVLIPKGDDNQPCIKAFEKATGIIVPKFRARKLEAISSGQTFIKVKGRNIPELIAGGYGDIGLTGSDSCEDFILGDESISYQTFGEKMCSLALLALESEIEEAKRSLKDQSKATLVGTSFPRLLNKCANALALNLKPTRTRLAGSIEIMPRLLGVPLVADLIATGKTAKANGLVEIQNLMDVYPAIVVRNKVKQPKTTSFDDIERIDMTLANRALQTGNTTIESTTINLLRDPNKAGKKASEEFGEVMMAIFGDGSAAECESEIADLIYSAAVAAYSRNKPVKLASITQTLIERNQQRFIR